MRLGWRLCGFRLRRSRSPPAIVSDESDTWRDVRSRYRHVSVDHRCLEADFLGRCSMGAYVERYDRVNDDFQWRHALSSRFSGEARRFLLLSRLAETPVGRVSKCGALASRAWRRRRCCDRRSTSSSVAVVDQCIASVRHIVDTAVVMVRCWAERVALSPSWRRLATTSPVALGSTRYMQHAFRRGSHQSVVIACSPWAECASPNGERTPSPAARTDETDSPWPCPCCAPRR